jgi:hypothetical protein
MILPLQIGFSLEKTAAVHFGRKWPNIAAAKAARARTSSPISLVANPCCNWRQCPRTLSASECANKGRFS